MTRKIAVDIPQGANLEQLRAELRAAVGEWVAGVSRAKGVYYIVVEDDAPADAETQMDATIAAHDPTVLTGDQQAQSLAEQAMNDAAAIPGWAGWSEQQALDYINTNVTDLDSAKTVMLAMARMLVALRNQTWPHLGVS